MVAREPGLRRLRSSEAAAELVIQEAGDVDLVSVEEAVEVHGQEVGAAVFPVGAPTVRCVVAGLPHGPIVNEVLLQGRVDGSPGAHLPLQLVPWHGEAAGVSGEDRVVVAGLGRPRSRPSGRSGSARRASGRLATSAVTCNRMRPSRPSWTPSARPGVDAPGAADPLGRAGVGRPASSPGPLPTATTPTAGDAGERGQAARRGSCPAGWTPPWRRGRRRRRLRQLRAGHERGSGGRGWRCCR